ncbi:bacteriophage CI repressor [Pseudoluteimonas lycopersici]|uniref:Bacteriophage CI repressor n=1 Tax=Pseudoluteimonas lycopersici TaxID=1324796 RepID=A0A516V300_9GAMM|nr:bacteriophage CI repressor [Lysobacter lycopersici]QDQ72896.1 bacteriophage CI repressor [Lysobacter lycopersici]
MELSDIIDQAKITAGVESDRAFAKHLKVSHGTVSNWRVGRVLPDAVSCERLAGLTGIPLAKVLGIVGEARAISREEKAVWRKLAASAVAVILMFTSSANFAVHAETSSITAKNASYVN